MNGFEYAVSTRVGDRLGTLHDAVSIRVGDRLGTLHDAVSTRSDMFLIKNKKHDFTE